MAILPFSSCLYHVYSGTGSPLPEHVSLTYPLTTVSPVMEMGETTGKAVVIFKIAALLTQQSMHNAHMHAHVQQQYHES